MTRLKIDYQGFKLGVRVASQLALTLNVKKEQDVFVLHKMKNMGHLIEGMRSYGAFGINNVTYAK